MTSAYRKEIREMHAEQARLERDGKSTSPKYRKAERQVNELVQTVPWWRR